MWKNSQTGRNSVCVENRWVSNERAVYAGTVSEEEAETENTYVEKQ